MLVDYGRFLQLAIGILGPKRVMHITNNTLSHSSIERELENEHNQFVYFRNVISAKNAVLVSPERETPFSECPFRSPDSSMACKKDEKDMNSFHSQ